ncbi:KH domain-containing protein HEN4-like isoform X4 [Vicia villosa]|uniref:KH domain-containing protein HEN4-like isoform X4 n=1 Tax=Vicia villosa TaxID=3911 RepID=UPI00273AAEAC|nr:KH domain-containing protein HEN4-like isoform X4 [Vicia villosa]
MKNTSPNFSVPPFPETPPPLHRPRNHMMPSGHPPPPPHVGLPHGIDHPAGPAMPVDHHQHAYSHGMGRGPPNMDRVPYPHGYEGPNSPRSWNPQAPSRGNPGATAGMNGSTVEITIPHIYLIHVYGENSSNLNQIRQISGANVVVHDPKPGATEGQVIVSGSQDQIHSALCLTQGFILCGQTSP